MTFVRFKGPVACMVCTLVAVSMAMVWTAPAEAVLTHQYTFNNGNLNDSVGGAHGTPMGGLDFSAFGGQVVFNDTDAFATLPTTIGLNTYTALTIETWFTNADTSNWQRLFDFGNRNGTSGNNYLFFSPSGAGNSRAVLGTAGNEAISNTGAVLPAGTQHHIAVTVNATSLDYYLNGTLIESTLLTAPTTPVSLSMIGQGTGDVFYFLGESLYTGDPFYNGTINEFRIYNNALTAMQIQDSFVAGPEGAEVGPELIIDRVTGAITFQTDVDVNNMIGYSILSDAGALNPDNWLTIADNYDQSSGGEFDDEGNWSILSQPDSSTDFTEFDFDGTNGGDLAAADPPLQLGAAGAWIRSAIEDLEMEIVLNDGTRYSPPVSFTGNGGNPYDPLDLNLDGDIDLDDWDIFRDNHLRDFDEEGLTRIEAALLGDLTGDGDSDFNDFIEFRDGFTAAAGAGSFAAAIEAAGGAAVPEPSTAMLLAFACSALSLLRGRSRAAGDTARG